MRLLVARTSSTLREVTGRLGCSDDTARIAGELAITGVGYWLG